MSDRPPVPLSGRVADRAHGNSSDAYRWLRARYGRLRHPMEGRFKPYGAVAAVMQEEGVLGGNGKPITAESVRQMWLRVLKNVAAEAERRKRQPSLLLGDVEPEVVGETYATAASPASPAQPSTQTGGHRPAQSGARVPPPAAPHKVQPPMESLIGEVRAQVSTSETPNQSRPLAPFEHSDPMAEIRRQLFENDRSKGITSRHRP